MGAEDADSVHDTATQKSECDTAPSHSPSRDSNNRSLEHALEEDARSLSAANVGNAPARQLSWSIQVVGIGAEPGPGIVAKDLEFELASGAAPETVVAIDEETGQLSPQGPAKRRRLSNEMPQ